MELKKDKCNIDSVSQRFYAVFQNFGSGDYAQRSIWFDENWEALEYKQELFIKGEFLILEKVS
tara:strand:- start:29711 stop:29899 length:189 start_codon:yes stop_codon:yes gene_type:complete